MPLQEFSSDEALKNLKSTFAVWPQRGKNNRKGIVPLPMVRPRFQIGDADEVFCMGSCFAHHVAAVMHNAGLKVITHVDNPHMSGHWGGSNHLIRYNVFSILNEFRWALDPAFVFPDDYFSAESEDRWMDPFGHSQEEPHSLEKLRRLREFTMSVTRRLATSRVVVVTMGLVELWFDTKTSLYTNIQPARHAMRVEPDRYKFRVADYEEIAAALEGLHALLKAKGHADVKILITTSPVPLHATFRGMDVFTANCYSKSVQRAAVEAFVARHDNVDYFPSYEAITLANPDLVWKEDQRHVTDHAVQAIMEHVLHSYAPQKQVWLGAIQRIKQIEVQLSQYGAQLTIGNMINVLAENSKLRAEVERLRQSIISNAKMVA